MNGKINILLNNAGVFSRTNWRIMSDINFTGAVTGSMVGIRRMGESHGGAGGTIIMTASLAGLLTQGWNNETEYVYTATKHGIVGFTR